MSEYHIHIPGLAEALAASRASARHTELLRTLRKIPELARLRLATPPHDDSAQWSLGPTEGTRGAPARRTNFERWMTRMASSTPADAGESHLYLVTDSGGDPADFLQICLSLGRAAPTRADRKAAATPRYRLEHAIDVGRLVTLAQTLGQESPPSDAAKPGSHVSRIFSDWYNSSAGRSGARLCDHWIMRFTDWTDPQTATRRISLMPGWTSDQALPEVRAERGNIQQLYRQLQQLDQRMGVPFSWFFHMLVGSRVQFDAGYHVLSAAEQGLLAMPDHDARVLRDWWARPYGY